MNHKKNMINLFKKITYKHNLWTVYSDFLEVSAISISNSVSVSNKTKMEKRYMDIIEGYSKEETLIFPEIFAELVMALEEEPTDILGEIFMELELGNKWKGQFFTPISISKLMGSFSLENADRIIKEKGFITVNEPACGGGSTIIGLALALKEKGYDYQKDILVTAVDLDIKAVHMCYIQLSLLGIPAVVYHGNSLLVEIYEKWETPFYLLNGWEFKKQNKPDKVVKLNIKKNGQLEIAI